MKKIIKYLVCATFCIFITFGLQAEILHSIVKKSGSYYYASFGSFDDYNFYSRLLTYVGSELASVMNENNNSVGLHMTIKPQNLKNGYTQSKILGKSYDFETENGFTEYEASKKHWFVKKLTPLGNASNVFKDAYKADLHTSIGYIYNKDYPNTLDFEPESIQEAVNL